MIKPMTAAVPMWLLLCATVLAISVVWELQTTPD